MGGQAVPPRREQDSGSAGKDWKREQGDRVMDGRHVDIRGRGLYLERMGKGTPTVVFESGSECGAASLRRLALAVQHVTRALL